MSQKTIQTYGKNNSITNKFKLKKWESFKLSKPSIQSKNILDTKQYKEPEQILDQLDNLQATEQILDQLDNLQLPEQTLDQLENVQAKETIQTVVGDQTIITDNKKSDVNNKTIPIKEINPTKQRNPSITTLIQPEIIPIVKINQTDVESPLNELLSICNQKRPIKFHDYFSGLYPIKKIGEASYSDVFLLTEPTRNVAVKIVPIGNEEQLDICSALLEIKTTKSLNNTNSPHIVQLFNVGVCTGLYPEWLLQLWNEYDEEKESENIDPSEYPKNQLYLILNLEFCGLDLEHTTLIKTKTQVFGIILQVILSLAQLEDEIEFEHRDLHWGNILLNHVNMTDFHYKFHDSTNIVLGCQSLKVTFIDFSFARYQINHTISYHDLEENKDWMFSGRGQHEEDGDLQFDIYRWMRESTKKDWSNSCSKTNIYVIQD
ncbi:hypothetical protein BC833DRAFT_618701 [Globomyces pollinis-pini]|nr:hypothetical protein BC833DRAFT_618701 [Globomyces pollinis-pini]